MGTDNTEPQRKEGFKGSQPRSLQTRPALPRIVPRKAPQNQRGLGVSVQINKITKIHHTTRKESLGKRFSCKYRINGRLNLWNSLPLDVLTALIALSPGSFPNKVLHSYWTFFFYFQICSQLFRFPLFFLKKMLFFCKTPSFLHVHPLSHLGNLGILLLHVI